MNRIKWDKTRICPNCNKEMQLTFIEEGDKAIYQHNQETKCILALPTNYETKI